MWIEVVSGPDRGRAVEVGGEPVTIGSGIGCALVVHGAGVEPLHGSARALPDGAVEVTEHGGATHALHAGDDLTLGDDALLLVGASPCDDVALLQVGDRGGLRALVLGRQEDVRQGEPVVAIGYPANGAEGGDLSSTAGVVSVAHHAQLVRDGRHQAQRRGRRADGARRAHRPAPDGAAALRVAAAMPTMRPVRRRSMVLVALAAALAVHAEVASAGSYRVYSCVAPSGGAAPVGDSSYGWQPSPRAQADSLSLVNSCASGQGLTARLAAPAAVPLGAGGQWIFRPPPETTISGFDLTWSGTAANGGESTISRSDQPDPTYERRYASNFASERVVENNLALSHLLVLVACSFANPCPAGADLASYRMTESTMTLRDNTAPTAANVSGDLIASPEWRGPMSLAFTAADSGSGVYRVIVSVDGQDALGVVVDGNDGRCADADATNADAHEFLWPVPCKASAAPQLAVDTGGLPVGAHAVSLLLEDAAGNRTPIYGPVAKTILAPPAGRGAANGAPASDAARFTGHRHRTLTTSFAHRRLRVRGRLVGPDGTPIAGARIDVLSQLHRAGSRFRDIGHARTNRRGGFSYKAPPGASRTLRFGYRSHLGDGAFTATLDVLQRVRASATLRASRRFVARGGRVTFRGRLRGGYVPPRGKLVELQATDRGRWRTFALIRSNRRGAFHYRHRFAGSGRFAFRARLRFERAYPYVLGYSRRTSVSVG